MRLAIVFLLALSSFIHAQDVIIGRDAAPINGELVTDNFLLFNKLKGSLRGGGLINSDNWAPDSIGGSSFAFGLNTLASGFGAFAIGSESKARGLYSVASGFQGIAAGDYSFAVGFQTKASGMNSFAAGYGTLASGYNAFTTGLDNTASGFHSFATGDFTIASGNAATSFGLATRARSAGETAIGIWNTDYTPQSANSWNANDRLFVIGNGENSSNTSDAMVMLKNGDVSFPDGSFLVGRDSMPKNGENINGNFMFYEDSIAAFRGGLLGSSNVWSPDSLGINSFAYGYDVKARGINSTALGFRTEALGGSSFAIGNQTLAYGGSTFAAGQRSIASGKGSAVFGSSTMSRSHSEFAIGHYNTDYVPLGIFNINEKDRLFVIGNGTSENDRSDAMVLLKNGDVRFPEGDFLVGRDSMPMNGENVTESLFFFDKNSGALRGGNLSSSANWSPDSIGNSSFAFGLNTLASGFGAFAIGSESKARGLYSVASGFQGIAAGDYSFAGGFQTKASGVNSFAVGSGNIASGFNAFSSGLDNQASGNHSFASGDFTIASGNAAASFGLATRARSAGEFAIGSWNTDYTPQSSNSWNANDRIFVIGNGQDSGNKSNAMIVLKNGNTTINGDVTISDPTSHANFYMQPNGGNEGRILVYQTNGHFFLGDIDNVGDNLYIKAGGDERITILNNGNVGIGNNSPSEKLYVAGNIYATGSITESSDIRYKKNFGPISNALAKVNELNGLYYDWNIETFPEKEFSDQRQIGVIAQEVEALFPEMVLTDSEGYKSVAYSRLTPVLIEAVKELTDQNEKLTSRMDKMEKQLALLLEASN